MRRFTAIVCLVSCFALHYGKIVSYWQCRISAATAAIRCDCEKLLLETHEAGTNHNNAAVIAKEKTEECYQYNDFTDHLAPHQIIISHSFPIYHSILPDGHAADIFQPPRFHLLNIVS